MKLDRSLIKSQAKGIIKGQICFLFIISMVVGILAGGLSLGVSAGVNAAQGVTDGIFDDKDYFDDFKDFTDDGKPNLDYFNNFNGSVSLVSLPSVNPHIITGISSRFGGILTIVMAPLAITLCGLYVMIIRGNKFKLGDMFKYVFTKTFDSSYIKKLLLYVLESLIISLMTLLFIIPGIIFYYRYYFANTIMADNPEVSPKEALKISKEMTSGHKGELFALDLSFIGWCLLVPLTLGLISIYTLPYYETTKALYYENFRIRCIQETSQPQLKFMTENEKMDFYAQQQTQQQAQPVQEVVEEPKDTFGSGMDNNYYNGNF